MEKSSLFNIPFVGLKLGKHFFSFSIDNTFFTDFEYNEFHNAQIDAELVLLKENTFLELSFKAKWFVTVLCDVSTELFDQPIDSQFELLVKFGEVVDPGSDEILIVPVGTYQIDVAQYFYEMIVLAVPTKRVHPGIADGTLKSEIVEKLKSLEPKINSLQGQVDPRWDKLNDLL